MLWLLLGFAAITYGMVFFVEYRREKRKKLEREMEASQKKQINEIEVE